MSQPSPDTRAIVRAADALTTQLRRIADALTTPVVRTEVVAGDALTTTDDGARAAHWRPVPLATLCGYCTHPYNWHVNGSCKFGTRTERCGCDTFTVGERPKPMDPVHILGVEATAAPCAQHPDAPVIGGICGGCTQYPADMRPAADDEQVQRWARREPLLVLLTRLQRGRALTETEAATLRQQVETEMREADQARHRADQVEELLRVAHETSNRSEAERTRAVQRAERAEAARDEEERMRLALAAERSQWKERATEAQTAIQRVRAAATWARHHHPGLRHLHERLAAALDGTEQPPTEE